MLLIVVILVVAAVLAVGAGYQGHLKRHLPYDMREVGTEGLPSDASIKSGELGRGAGSNTFRNI